MKLNDEQLIHLVMEAKKNGTSKEKFLVDCRASGLSIGVPRLRRLWEAVILSERQVVSIELNRGK